jgi:hypothetical protein
VVVVVGGISGSNLTNTSQHDVPMFSTGPLFLFLFIIWPGFLQLAKRAKSKHFSMRNLFIKAAGGSLWIN